MIGRFLLVTRGEDNLKMCIRDSAEPESDHRVTRAARKRHRDRGGPGCRAGVDDQRVVDISAAIRRRLGIVVQNLSLIHI